MVVCGQEDYLKMHKCAVYETCNISDNWKLFFCVICRKAGGFETPEGRRIYGKVAIDTNKQKVYNEKTLLDNI